jgi:hypothetical protein
MKTTKERIRLYAKCKCTTCQNIAYDIERENMLSESFYKKAPDAEKKKYEFNLKDKYNLNI